MRNTTRAILSSTAASAREMLRERLGKAAGWKDGRDWVTTLFLRSLSLCWPSTTVTGCVVSWPFFTRASYLYIFDLGISHQCLQRIVKHRRHRKRHRRWRGWVKVVGCKERRDTVLIYCSRSAGPQPQSNHSHHARPRSGRRARWGLTAISSPCIGSLAKV
jgi:hypothetical protein